MGMGSTTRLAGGEGGNRTHGTLGQRFSRAPHGVRWCPLSFGLCGQPF